MAEDDKRRITGKIIDSGTGRGLSGLRVELYDHDAKHSDYLGSSTTDAQGRFMVEFDAESFKDSPQERGPDVVAKVFDGERLILTTQNAPIKNWTPDRNPLVLELDYGDEPADPDQSDDTDDDAHHIVEGEVVDPRGRRLPGFPVGAFDRALCDWRLLGEAATNDQGRYRITYAKETLAGWGKARADLKVEVYDRATGDEVLAASPLILQARPREVLDFSIGGEYVGPDEHSRVRDALEPLLRPVEDLACLEVADVLILARESGQASANVTYYVKARRWSDELGIEPAMLYGLLRQGEPTSLDGLLARPLSRLWQSLERAKRLNVIDVPLGEEQQARLAAVQQDYLLRADQPFSRLLDTTRLDAQQQAAFTGLLTSGTVEGDAFWNALQRAEVGLDESQVDDLRSTFALQTLTGDNTALTIHLRTSASIGHPGETAAYSVDNWLDALAADGVGVPDSVLPGEPEPLRRQSYAQALYRAAEARYPTASLTARMGRDAAWAGQPAPTWLAANPAFEFRDERLLLHLAQHPRTLASFADPDAVRQDLLRLEQLFHLTAGVPEDRFDTIRPLWDAGLGSAAHIAYGGRQALLRQVDGQVEAGTANTVYDQAVRNASLALNVYMRYSPQVNGLSLNALNLSPSVSESALGTPDLPDWEALFGSADTCACDHCESVLSPAAYLVDMLAFLGRATDDTGRTGLEIFLERRSDIGALDLTCENTDTELPQIDLFIEIAEQIIANSSDGITIPTTDVGQTTWDSRLLAAQPEHLEPGAYDVLRQARYPLSLPFDLWLVEGRRYLAQMGIERAELMRWMPAQPGVGPKQVAAESLGLSPGEAEIIATPRSREPVVAAYWGIDITAGSLRSQLQSVESFLLQAQIEYDALLRLLDTCFLNPGRLTEVTFAGDECSLVGAELNGGDTVRLIERGHRFMRLQRRLGWTETELDQAIRAVGVNDFDDAAFFPMLAALAKLRIDYGRSVEELASWWADLDTYVYAETGRSQYEALFLDPARFPNTGSAAGIDLLNDVFALRPDGADLAITQSADPNLSNWLAELDGSSEPVYRLNTEYAGHVQSAIGLTSDDLTLLAAEVLPKDATLGHVALNLANLSLLYRIASFTSALGISVADYLRLLRLTDLTPLSRTGAAATPLDTLRFIETWRAIDDSGWSLLELDYLLLHGAEAAAASSPVPEDIDELLTALSTAVADVAATSAGDSILAAKADEQRLALITLSLGATLGLGSEILDALLWTIRPGLGDDLLAHLLLTAIPDRSSTRQPAQDFASLYETLHKFALAWNPLRLASTDLEALLTRGPAIGWTDIAALPLTEQTDAGLVHWQRLVRAAELQRDLFSDEQTLLALLDEPFHSAGGLDREAFIGQAADWTGWSLDDLTYLLGPDGFGLTYPNDFRGERWLSDLERCLAPVRPLGVSAAQAHRWAASELNYEGAQAIKQALTLAYDHDTWLDVMAGLQDDFRRQRRDALLGYLLSQRPGEDASGLYAYYLLDPETDACATTSRMVQAHASVQLFAQRILLNLEPTLTFSREDAEAWAWRKNYRVWQAAREIFLTPQNWLLPEVRDNKSAFFEELESGLLEDEVTNDYADTLYLEYLHKLDAVSRLEIMGMYQDEENGILHVFGRTKDFPRGYYYRRLEDGVRWTPWEEVPLDISADHLIPVVYQGRLWLFWPEFRISEESTSNGGDGQADEIDPAEVEAEIEQLDIEIAELESAIETLQEETANGDHNNNLPGAALGIATLVEELAQKTQERDFKQRLLEKTDLVETYRYSVEVGMAWSRYRDGQWEPQLQGEEPASYQTDLSAEKHFFLGWIGDDEVLRIGIKTLTGERSTIEPTLETYVGHFYLDDCHGGLAWSTATLELPHGAVTVLGAYQAFHSWDIFTATTLELLVTHYSGPHEPASFHNSAILDQVLPGVPEVHFAHQYGLGGAEHSPFFCTEGSRTWYVAPEEVGALSASVLTAGVAASPSLRSMPSISAAPQRAVPQVDREKSLDIVDYSTSLSDVSQQGWLEELLQPKWEPQTMPGEAVLDVMTKYRFASFYAPHTCLFLKQLSRRGVDGLLAPDPTLDQDSEDLYRQLMPHSGFDFEAIYQPTESVIASYPTEEVDFNHDSAYGSYHWELFFHIPFLFATSLTANQRFEEARVWFHYIFDPTATDGNGTERFWRIRPFYEHQLGENPETLADLVALAQQGDLRLEQQVVEWERQPFQPFAIARMRIVAFMQATVMAYIDNLIQHGDMLFAQDQREQIEEARQLYVLAREILGDRPSLLPKQDPDATYTPNDILSSTMSGVQVNPFRHLDLLNGLLGTREPGGAPWPKPSRVQPDGLPVTAKSGATVLDTLLLFCMPPNAKLSQLWDTVEDRLFKVRHCMNLEGQVRRLALYAPPIPPGLLVKAAAAGLEIADIISGLYAPLPNYRFAFMLQKATELCNEVRSLGAALLTAVERSEAEELAQLRSNHEVRLLKWVQELKERQIDEAQAALDGASRARLLTEKRRNQYLALLDKGRIRQEREQLTQLEKAKKRQKEAQVMRVTASGLHSTAAFIMVGAYLEEPAKAAAETARGLAYAADGFGGVFTAMANDRNFHATKASLNGTYARRKESWDHQKELADKELNQIDKQIQAAEIRLQIAEQDLENHKEQIAQAQAQADFLSLKFTNKELYGWMLTELSSLFFQTYQIAYQYAVQAQRTFQHELGPDEAHKTFIAPAYWDSLKKGLLAGEQLQYDLRRMEQAHIEANRRELEVTKTVSLFQLDPEQLLELRMTGSCAIEVPEVAFAIDHPGHYFRRIKAVRITIPGVVGPSTGVSATLTLTASSVRRVADTDAQDPFDPTGLEAVSGIPQESIATSTGNSDSGLFELNFNDPRYLPFEGAGAVSYWRLDLPSSLRPFDYSSISDVLLHISYSARDAGSIYRDKVNDALLDALNDSGFDTTRLVSLRRELPTEWSRLLNPADGQDQAVTLTIDKSLFPSYLDFYWDVAGDAKAITLNIDGAMLYLQPSPGSSDKSGAIEINGQAISKDVRTGLYPRDLTSLVGGTLGHDGSIDATVAVDKGELIPGDWDDIYLSLEYRVERPAPSS